MLNICNLFHIKRLMMNSLYFIYIFLQISDEILSATLKKSSVEDPELSEEYYQGDIQHRSIGLRSGIRKEILRWPNATVYYQFGENEFDENQVNSIKRGMEIISENSCIKFQLRPKNSTYYLRITSKNSGCNVDYLGWQNTVRNLNLKRSRIGQGCFRIGTIMHELLHVLGFEHQHVVTNRDEYININWNNIKPNFRSNFEIDNKKQPLGDFGEEYDYESVMHYPRNAFSINRTNLWTLEPIRTGGERMGQRDFLSKKDIIKLNRMYNCSQYA